MCVNLTMSMTLRFPKEKAMALGGVATGSMNAREAAMVQGSITYSGWILIATACKKHSTGKYMEKLCVYTCVCVCVCMWISSYH